MAVRNTSPTEAGASRRTWFVAVSLLVLFATALFLRTYWNVDAAQNEEGQFVLSSGSDPYYEKRAIDAIQENGYQTLIFDPLLNYPYGAVNPNPPLYQWSVATAGQLLAPFFDGDLTVATWWATEWAPAIYGTLTIFPIYFMAATLFGRREGLVAALFWTVSTEAIDVTGLGDSRHYAAAVFFTSLAFLFYIKTIEQFRGDGNWVRTWKGPGVGSGLGALFRDRRLGFGYALLTGMSIAGVALMWKGFPYIIGVMFLYACLQMVIDHWRNRDSTGLFLATLVAMLVGTLVAYPYYLQADVANFVRPVWFMIGAFVIAGAVMVPTRELPTILVMPAAVIVAIIGVVAAFWVFPEVAQSLLYATVYFKKTALYETIQEAHPADFGQIVFAIGPIPFFAAFFGWFVLLFTVRRYPRRALLFTLLWGLIALYMATSAARFLINAIPVFAVLGAFMTVWVFDWLDFGTIKKSLAANRGNAWTGFRKGISPLQIVAVVLAVLTLVLPTTLLAADAAIPGVKEREYSESTSSPFLKNFYDKRLGAYGQGFIFPWWQEGLTWLDRYDANTTSWDARPALLAWWDYGHWTIAVGKHPAVADNFQNGYQFSGNFIISQNETQAVQLLAARFADLPAAKFEDALRDVGVADPAASAAKLRAFEFDASIDLVKATQLVAKVEENSGKRIRYFATEIQMLPVDDPQTVNIERSSIFYAPVKLAGQDPDDYVALKIQVGSQFYTEKEFEDLARDPTKQINAQSQRIDYSERFFNSMFWRGWAGAPVCDATAPSGSCISGPFPVDGTQVNEAARFPRPAFGLQHFRLIYATPELRFLEYTPGAIVTGTLREEGSPIGNATVTAYDDAGTILLEMVRAGIREDVRSQISSEDLDVPHGTGTTDANGAYSLVAPFAMEGGNVTIVATKDGIELARVHLPITKKDADERKQFTADLTVVRGSVAGTLFLDENNDGRRDAANESTISGVNVTIGGKTATSDANGNFTLDGVSPGAQNVTIGSDTYGVAASSRILRVEPGTTTNATLALVFQPATYSGVTWADLDGDGNRTADELLDVDLAFAPDANVTDNSARNGTATTDGLGNYTATLQPGSYVVTGTHVTAEGKTYTIRENLVVAAGETRARDFLLVESA